MSQEPIGYIFQLPGKLDDKWFYSHGKHPALDRVLPWVVKPVYAEVLSNQPAPSVALDHGEVDDGVRERAERAEILPGLWNAIVHHTQNDSAFWLGETLLNEITKETGYCGPHALSHQPAPVAANVHTNSKAIFEARQRGNVFGRFVNEQLKKACDDEVAPVAANASAKLIDPFRISNLLKAMEDECWTLRCVDIQTGGDDADVGWEVIQHHQAKPHERMIAFGRTPEDALRNAVEISRAR